MNTADTTIVTNEATAEQTISILRAKIIKQQEEREALLSKVEKLEKGGVPKQTLKVVKNTVGIAGVAAAATAVVIEVVGFTTAKIAGLDYEIGSACKALFKLGTEPTAT